MCRKSKMHTFLKSETILLLNCYENGYLIRLKNWYAEAGFVPLSIARYEQYCIDNDYRFVTIKYSCIAYA